jgi:ATP-dependent RNA helicase DeaD
LTFTDFRLSTELHQAVADLGFETPTPIQEGMIPHLLEEPVDVVGLAHTGTGKTAAFGLPIIHRLDLAQRKPQALILCPTRELCVQITDELTRYGKHTRGLSITSIYGGDSYTRQLDAVARGTHIIVATPGRLIDLLARGRVDLSGIRDLVLDEADIMLNMGFRDEIDSILETAPEERRTILLSATMPREVAAIAERYMKNPVNLSVCEKNSGPQAVDHRFCVVKRHDKYEALKRIVDFHPDIYGIVFCRTKAGTQEIAEKLVADGYHAEALHGDLSQSQRELAMGKFRSGAVRLLVATDIAARGLDVDDLTHVIHYDLPTEGDIYTHRSGRTGRAGKTGVSLSIISPAERQRLRWIERGLRREFTETKVPGKHDILRKQLDQSFDRIIAADVNEEELGPFLPAVEEKLESLTREDLVRRLASLELERLFAYYRDRDDLASADKGYQRRERDPRNAASARFGSRRRSEPGGAAAFDWLAVDLGRTSRILPQQLIGLVNRSTRSRDIRLGRIDIGQTRSWIQVASESVSTVLAALREATFDGRKVRVERAAESPGRAK